MKSIIITGAAGGIGRETVRSMASENVELVCVDVSDAAVSRLLDDMADLPGTRTGVVSSLVSEQACAQCVAACSGAVSGLVHLAGVFEQDIDGDAVTYDRAIAHNLTNAYHLGHAVHNAMGETDTGSFVFTSSLAFMRGGLNNVAYSASKGGIVGMARAMSRKFAPKVRVNAIAPGIIKTAMTVDLIKERGDAVLRDIPLQRYGEASEIASVINFLMSDAASYVTGQTLSIDGGIVNG